MTYRKNDPFGLGSPAWYAANYQNWTPVTLPDGRVVYEVPGFPGYTYDPVKSRATGNASFTVNPQSQITAAKTQDDQAKAEEDLKLKAAQAQLDSQDPVHQLIPAVTGTAGTVGSLYAANKLGLIGPQGTTAAKVAQQVTSPAQQAAQGAQQATNGVGNSAISTDTTTGEQFSTPVSQGDYNQIANSGNVAPEAGSWLTDAPANFSLNQGVSAAAAAYAGYNAYNDWSHGGSGRTALTEGGAAVGNMIAGPVGAAAGAVGGNIIGYGLQGDSWKNNLALGSMTGGLALIPGVGDFIRGGLIHKGTKQVQNEDIAALSTQSNDAGYQNDLAEAANASRLGTYLTDKNGVTHDKWEDTMASGADPNQLVNALGNLQTYGAKWSSLTPQQKLAVTQANINSGIYDPNLGVVGITDKDTAQSNLDKVLGGTVTPATTTTPGQAAANGALGDNQRTITRSPGILANGHHIVYGQ